MLAGLAADLLEVLPLVSLKVRKQLTTHNRARGEVVGVPKDRLHHLGSEVAGGGVFSGESAPGVLRGIAAALTSALATIGEGAAFVNACELGVRRIGITRLPGGTYRLRF